MRIRVCFPYEPLPTADDDLIVAAANDAQFRKLCEVLGIPEVCRGAAVRAQRGPDGQPRRAAPGPGRPAGEARRPRVVRSLGRRRGAVRADQHHRRRVCHGRAVRPRPDRRGWTWRTRGTQYPPSHPILGIARHVRAATTSARRAQCRAARMACPERGRTPCLTGRAIRPHSERRARSRSSCWDVTSPRT